MTIEKKWPGVMHRLLTNKIPWQDHKTWFNERGSGIKSTLEIYLASDRVPFRPIVCHYRSIAGHPSAS